VGQALKYKKSDWQNLICLVVGLAGFTALIVFPALALNKLVNTEQFLTAMGIATLILTLNSIYIKKHFVNGKWV
jgi:hypothetical protein